MNIRFDYQLGERSSPLQEKALKEAFRALYAFAGAKLEDHFIFTSSGAEAINHAVFTAYIDITRKTGRNHFLCGTLDEAPTILAMSRLQEAGCVFQMIPVDANGRVNKKNLTELITPRTAMLSLSAANGLTGVIQPLQEVVDLCRERDILFHLEASHILAKSAFTFEECGADVLTFDGFPSGTGGLFYRDSNPISPFILGGHEQGGMRAGPFQPSQLIELARWAKQEQEESDHYGIEVARLRALFEELLCEKVASARPLFKETERLPHISCMAFPGAHNEALAYLLAIQGIHACIGGNRFQHLNHLLKACGLSDAEAHSGISFAFSAETSEEEIVEGAEKIAETVLVLQKRAEKVFT